MHLATGLCTKNRIHVVPGHDGFAISGFSAAITIIAWL
jgi:hypothetical protein